MTTARRITIAGVTFTCSRASAWKLQRALWAGKILRLYPGYDTDTAEVCRDLLLEKLAAQKRHVSDKRVSAVVALLAPAKLPSFQQLLHALWTNITLATRKTAEWTGRNKETIIKLALALLALVEVMHLLSWMHTYSQLGNPYRYQAVFYGTIEVPAVQSTTTIALIQLGVGLCILLLSLSAMRHKKVRWILLPVLIVVGVGSPQLGTLIHSPSPGSYAIACGDRILTDIDVPQQRNKFSVTSAHWKLAAPITNATSLRTQQACDTYLGVRKSNPYAQLVVASYVLINNDGVRHFDPVIDTGTDIRYGFFVSN